MTMNQQQTKYAKDRIASLYSEKSLEIDKKYKKDYKAKSPEEILTLLKEGRYQIREEIPKSEGWNGYSYGSSDLRSYIKLEGDEELDDIKKNRAAAQLELQKDKNRMLDELLLGDVQEALEILRTFAAKEY